MSANKKQTAADAGRPFYISADYFAFHSILNFPPADIQRIGKFIEQHLLSPFQKSALGPVKMLVFGGAFPAFAGKTYNDLQQVFALISADHRSVKI